jgi:hypothetical protein
MYYITTRLGNVHSCNSYALYATAFAAKRKRTLSMDDKDTEHMRSIARSTSNKVVDWLLYTRGSNHGPSRTTSPANMSIS